MEVSKTQLYKAMAAHIYCQQQFHFTEEARLVTAEIFSTHFVDPVSLFLQSAGQRLAVATFHKSPMVTTETVQTPPTWPLQALHLLHHG